MKVTCPDCWGVGELMAMVTCPKCKGHGEVEQKKRTTFRQLEALADELSDLTSRPFSILQSSPQANGTRKYALMEAHRYSDLVPSPYYLKAGALADILRNEIAARLDAEEARAERRAYAEGA